MFSKIFGLKRQTNAFLEIYLFSNKNKDNKFEIDFIDGAKILLKRKNNNSDILELSEKMKGKYEIITEPGEVQINVIIQGKEEYNKDLILNNGLNTLRIEL